MTVDELITAFQVHLLTFSNGLVIQKLLLKIGSPGDEVLSSRRVLSLMEGTELRSIFLATFPEIKLDPADINTVNSVISIKNNLLPYDKVLKKAVNELKGAIPLETVDLINDYLVQESPLYYSAVAVFVVTVMVLIEAEEI